MLHCQLEAVEKAKDLGKVEKEATEKAKILAREVATSEVAALVDGADAAATSGVFKGRRKS